MCRCYWKLLKIRSKSDAKDTPLEFLDFKENDPFPLPPPHMSCRYREKGKGKKLSLIIGVWLCVCELNGSWNGGNTKMMSIILVNIEEYPGSCPQRTQGWKRNLRSCVALSAGAYTIQLGT
jgi:hypothetical protein